jgi:hypothetical protein
MSDAPSVFFYVTLKDDFEDRCVENEKGVLFEDLENPYKDAEERLTPGRIYPVLGIGEDGRRLTVIDDRGRPWKALTGLFKYAEDQQKSAGSSSRFTRT